MVSMRKLDIISDRMSLSEEVELIYEKRITPFGTSAKLDVPKKYRDGGRTSSSSRIE